MMSSISLVPWLSGEINSPTSTFFKMSLFTLRWKECKVFLSEFNNLNQIENWTPASEGRMKSLLCVCQLCEGFTSASMFLKVILLTWAFSLLIIHYFKENDILFPVYLIRWQAEWTIMLSKLNNVDCHFQTQWRIFFLFQNHPT